MRRIAIFFVIGLAGLAFVFLQPQSNSHITITDASISRMVDGSFLASARITNTGGADQFLGTTVDGFQDANFMGGAPVLVIPGTSSVLLAMDGAHVTGQSDKEFEEGQLAPLTIRFKNAGPVTARARFEASVMNHGSMAGLEDANVRIEFSDVSSPGREGISGAIKVEGLNLVSRAMGTAHKNGEGHAHIYLNGLKLQRLYKPEFSIGALTPGNYTLRVTLNANDHRLYVRNGDPTAAEFTFVVD